MLEFVTYRIQTDPHSILRPGDHIFIEYMLVNQSNQITIDQIQINDPLVNSLIQGRTRLEATRSLKAIAKLVLTDKNFQDGSIQSTAIATSSFGTSNSLDLYWRIPYNPQISVVRQNKGVDRNGLTRYRYHLINTGNENLHHLKLTDPKLGYKGLLICSKLPLRTHFTYRTKNQQNLSDSDGVRSLFITSERALLNAPI
jgi:hypothetical protein